MEKIDIIKVETQPDCVQRKQNEVIEKEGHEWDPDKDEGESESSSKEEDYY